MYNYMYCGSDINKTDERWSYLGYTADRCLVKGYKLPQTQGRAAFKPPPLVLQPLECPN